MIKEISFKANENGTMNGFISGKDFSSMHEEIIHTIQFNNVDFDDIQIENCVTDGTKYLILKGEIKEQIY